MERRIGKYERLARERNDRDLALAAQPGGHPKGFYFDAAAGDRVVQFIEGFCKHHKGEWAGKPLTLEPWAKWVVRTIFGWKRADGMRRFRTAWEEIARKNGKTTKAAGGGLYMLVGDREPGAEVYCTATKEAQAKILHNDAVAMVKASPDLARFVRSLRSNLSCAELGSKFEPLGADSTTLDGLNPHAHFPDEVHAHKDPGVWSKLDTGMGARRQPLTWAITTAGVYDPTGVGWQKHDYAVSVLEGAFEDDEFFAFIAAIEEDDDPFDPANWGKANPNVNVSIYESYLASQAQKAQRDPGFYNDFLQLHLNRWTQQVTRWLQPEKWKACDPLTATQALEQRAGREAALHGRDCWGGLDLASRNDLAAFGLAFPGPEDVTDLLLRCWIPQGRVDEEAKRGRKHYEQWVREGWLTVTPGDVIDYGFIRREINELGTKYRIREIAYDPHDATKIVTELGEEDGLTMVEHRQGFISMNVPTKGFETRVTAKKFRHGGNPILAWSVGNAVVKKDSAGSLKPDKEHAKDKIDPLVAEVMANGRADLCAGTGGSIYETRGVLRI